MPMIEAAQPSQTFRVTVSPSNDERRGTITTVSCPKNDDLAPVIMVRDRLTSMSDNTFKMDNSSAAFHIDRGDPLAASPWSSSSSCRIPGSSVRLRRRFL
mmetsp:Transcript_10584/g.12465  ORF Transcript_10584/g.12465 Transcript_10584/m.12465 type:complete len:100 (-) Transcript_10584:412-711(-)